jgi:hypothetical protein
VNSSQPRVHSKIGCQGEGKKKYMKLKLNVSKEDDLIFLIDSHADLSPMTGKKLIGSTRYDPRKRVNVESVQGSETENFRTVKADVQVRYNSVPFEY